VEKSRTINSKRGHWETKSKGKKIRPQVLLRGILEGGSRENPMALFGQKEIRGRGRFSSQIFDLCVERKIFTTDPRLPFG
jgi:hypothetical protein